MSEFPPTTDKLNQKLAREIRASAAVIHLVGRDFGACPEYVADPEAEPPRSYTQQEYDLAVAAGRPVYLIFAADDFPFLPDRFPGEDPVLKASQQRHRDALMATTQSYEEVHDLKELEIKTQWIAAQVAANAEQKGFILRSLDYLLVLLLGAAVWLGGEATWMTAKDHPEKSVALRWFNYWVHTNVVEATNSATAGSENGDTGGRVVSTNTPPPAPTTGALEIRHPHVSLVAWHWQLRYPADASGTVIRSGSNTLAEVITVAGLSGGTYSLSVGETPPESGAGWKTRSVDVENGTTNKITVLLDPARLRVHANLPAALKIQLPRGLEIVGDLRRERLSDTNADYIWGQNHHWLNFRQVESGDWQITLRLERYDTIHDVIRVAAGTTVEAHYKLNAWSVPHRAFDWTNSVGQVLIPIGHGFWAGEQETTAGQFREFALDVGLRPEKYRDFQKLGWKMGSQSWADLPNPQPVCGITAAEAEAFCKWLTAREFKQGRLRPTQSYQLPTREHWMELYGTSPILWPTASDGAPPYPTSANLGGQELRGQFGLDFNKGLPPWQDAYLFAAPADGALATPPFQRQGPFGLYHLVGNVSEWSADSDLANTRNRLTFGGSWLDSLKDSFCRTCAQPVLAETRSSVVGFRIVLVDSDRGSE